MAIKTKDYFAEQVQLKINPGGRPKDEKIKKPEIILVMDQVMNFLASQNFTENFILHGRRDVADQYLATFEDVVITDNTTNSEITLPAEYADLPMNQGIYEVYPTNDIKARFFVVTSRNSRRRKNLMEGNMENGVFCYPVGDKLIFSKNNLKVVHKTLTVRLVVTDSANITASARYPVPPNKEKEFIDMVYEYFTQGTVLEEDILNDDVKTR